MLRALKYAGFKLHRLRLEGEHVIGQHIDSRFCLPMESATDAFLGPKQLENDNVQRDISISDIYIMNKN